MPFIEVKQDPTIEHSDVVVQLSLNTSPEEVGEEYYDKNPTEKQQTSIYGVLCPIIELNHIVIQADDILNFVLDDTGKIPTVRATLRDRYNLIQYFESPGPDNEMRVIILPPFDNAYKKINLNFYITGYNVLNKNMNIFYVTGSYKLPNMTNSQYKSFGEISTYKLFEEVAKETKLGFATNVEDKEDKRFIYNNYNSYIDILNKSIKNTEGKDCVYDWFIDCWDYLTLIDVKDRLNTLVLDKDNQVWISNSIDEITEGIEIIPMQTVGTLTNMFGAEESQLYVSTFRKIANTSNNSATDKVATVYNMDKSDVTDTYLGNEDVQEDIFTKYEYKGEVYGDYDYKTAEACNKSFYQKLKMETLEVDLRQPFLALLRGEKINFECYFADDNIVNIEKALDDKGLLNKDVQPATNTEDPNPNNDPNFIKLDKTVTGQYLVIGNQYKFKDKKWTHTCILVRPADQKVNLVDLSKDPEKEKKKEKRYNPSDSQVNIPDSGSRSSEDATVNDKQGYDKWIACVQNMANFYQENIHTYQGDRGVRQNYMCPLINDNVQDDCSSFVRACLRYFGINCPSICTESMQPGGKFDTLITSSGFKRIPYNKESRQKGDIICGGAKTHTEIMWDNGKVMSWGAVHDKAKGGLPCGFAKSIDYMYIWRYVGK